jgi:hypothetical protein
MRQTLWTVRSIRRVNAINDTFWFEVDLAPEALRDVLARRVEAVNGIAETGPLGDGQDHGRSGENHPSELTVL